MAYIETHEGLPGHPKTKRAARLLGISRPLMVGHLICLWTWCLHYADEGDLSQYDAEDIADAAGWEGDPDAFVSALLDCGPGEQAGFLERDGSRLLVHDWWDYAGKLIERRKANRERMRAARAEHVQRTESAHEDTNSPRAGANVTKLNGTEPTRPKQTKSEPRADAPSPVVASPDDEQDTPFGLCMVLCQENGVEWGDVAPAGKKEQLGKAKQLIEQGFGADKTRRCLRYLKSQHWRTGLVDLGTVLSEGPKWELNGEPATEKPKGTPAVVANGPPKPPLDLTPIDELARERKTGRYSNAANL